MRNGMWAEATGLQNEGSQLRKVVRVSTVQYALD